MEYQIEITYKTGNSFGTHTERERVGCVWDSLEEAKDALKSIREHLEYCKTSRLRPRKETPVTWTWYNEEYSEGSLLIFSGGKQFRIHAFWQGWFETLLKAEIVFDDNDLIFEP
jgi:hypothetical protein